MWKNWLKIKPSGCCFSKKIAIHLIVLLVGLNSSYAQFTFDWGYDFNSCLKTLPRDIKTDCEGNIYVLGYFADAADMDPGLDSLLIAPAGLYDMFLQKLSPQGQLIWVKTWNFYGFNMDFGTEPTPYNALEIDCNGYVYITGEFSIPADFDPGPDSTKLTPVYYGLVNWVYNQNFLLKLDTSGNFQWVRSYQDTTSGFRIRSMRVNSEHNLVVMGSLSGAYDFDPGPGTHILYSSPNGTRICVGEYNSQGDFTWIKATGVISGNHPRSGIAIDSEDNIIVYESFLDTVDIDPGPGNYLLGQVDTYFEYNFLLAKLDPAGNLIWANWLDGIDSAYPHDITTDSEDNIIICGRILRSMDFDPGPGTYMLGSDTIFTLNGFLASYSSAGQLNWANLFEGCDMFIYDIEIDKLNQIYGTGYATFNTLDYDPGPGVQYSSNGRNFVFCFHPDGNFNWVQNFPSSEGVALDIDSVGSLITTGSIRNGPVDFDPGSGQWFLGNPNSFFGTYVLKFLQPDLSIPLTDGGALLIYPNPVQERFYVQLPLGSPQEVLTRILDATGRIVYANIGFYSGSGSIEIPWINHPHGSYILQIHGKNRSYTAKFVW